MKKLLKNRKPKRTAEFTNEGILESLWGIAKGTTQQGGDLAKQMISLDKLQENLGYKDDKEKQKHHGGDLSEGEELNLKELHDKKKERTNAEPGIDYARQIVHAGERLASRETQEIETQLRELMMEIKKLADSSKELQTQFKDVAVEQHVVKPGKYHKSFFAWMLSMIRIARKKVEDSGAWLAAMQSKKKSREYGSMAKKHGTTFTLNNERTVATQTG